MTDSLEAELAARLTDTDRFASDLRAARARRPGRSVLFPSLGDARMRRQIVRWMGHEHRAATPGILETLRTALDDRDWEVRASAIVTAARVRAVTLGSAVRESALPSPHQHGLDERDARLLVAVRTIAVEALQCADVDDTDRESAVRLRLPDAPPHLVRAVLRQPVQRRDAAWLFVQALATPAALADAMPEPLPPGIVRRERRLWLADAVEMCWVSPHPHLLGGAREHEGGDDEASASVREHVPGGGFFVARRPLGAAELKALGVPAPTPLAPAEPETAARLALMDDPPAVVSHHDAERLCDAITSRLGTSLELPTADELECAARGTDGRRYAWGNGLERLDGRERSPHGIERFAVPVGQWTSSRGPGGQALALGGPTSPRCSDRVASAGGNALRPLLRVGVSS